MLARGERAECNFFVSTGVSAEVEILRAKAALRMTGALLISASQRTCPVQLTWQRFTPQTTNMAHIYVVCDFGKDEEKAQQARHKLEGWKQAFRLDKKLLYKIERTGEATPTDGEAKAVKTEKAHAEKAPAKAEKAKGKNKASAPKTEPVPAPAKSNEDIKLLIRLAFSGHEKLTEQRWVQRIPGEEPFKDFSPKMVKGGDAAFEATEKQFDELT
jgi:hypothetical protein